MAGKDLGAELLTKIVLKKATKKDFNQFSSKYLDIMYLLDDNRDMLSQFNVSIELWPNAVALRETNVGSIEETPSGDYFIYFPK